MDAGLLVMGGVGGINVLLLNLLEDSKLQKDRRPDYTDPLYIASYFISAGLGIVIVFAYIKSGTNLNYYQALHLGVTAPLILLTAVSAAPKETKLPDSEA